MEAKYVMVSNPTCTFAYLGHRSEEIQTFLTKHYGCELKLLWRDDHLDSLWEEGFKSDDLD
jgi:hypothetical protein